MAEILNKPPFTDVKRLLDYDSDYSTYSYVTNICILQENMRVYYNKKNNEKIFITVYVHYYSPTYMYGLIVCNYASLRCDCLM